MILRRQRVAGMLLISFFVLLVSLTLLSNTIQTAMLPKVTTEKPVNKMLTYAIEGSGIITPRQTTALTSDSGWRIAEVHVSENERVEKGQVLLTFDSSETERMLLDEEDRLQKMLLSQEALQEQYVIVSREGDDEAVRSIERQLQSGQLDLNIQQRRIDQLRQELIDNRTLTAPHSGMVSNLKAEEGMSASPGQELFELIRTDEGFQFSFATDEIWAQRLQVEVKIAVEVKGEARETLEGTIIEIKDAEQGGEAPDAEHRRKTVVVSVFGDSLQGGEAAAIHIEAQAEEQGLVIRKERLKKDESGDYVLVIRENTSSLGNTYTVHKRYVKIGDGNGEEIIILDGLSIYDDIVAETSEPLQEGNRMRLD